MLKPLNRLRPTLRASALVLGTLLALGLPLGCGDDTEPEEPIEEEVEPLTLTRGTRALVVGEQDIEIVRASVSLETEQIPALFPRVVLQRQLYDELPYQGTEEELRFGARVPELWTAIQADYGAFEQVVVALDVLTADGSAVVGPPSFKENARTFTRGNADPFSAYVTEQTLQGLRFVAERLGDDQELLFVAGVGVNRLPLNEFIGFKELYAGSLRPEVEALARELGVEISSTVGLDWDTLVRQHAAAAATAEEAGMAVPTDADVWADTVEGIEEGLDVVVVRSFPDRYERVSDLAEDHYQRLRAVVGPATPVAFLPLYWPTSGPEDTYGAEEFLRSFRKLAGGVRLEFVAWPRFIDLDAQACGRYAGSLGAATAMCYSGLVKSSGKPKALWDELLDDSTP